MLIYGEPGAGKTYFLGTAMDIENFFPILILDAEGGTLTLRDRPGVDVKPVRTIEDIENIHNSLYKDYDTGDGYYKTVGIDSLNEIQSMDLKTVALQEYNTKPDKLDKDVPSQRAWGKSRNRMSRIIRAYRDLPCHTICTALLNSEFDENTGITSVYPAFPGKMRGEVPGYFDIVGYLRAEEQKIDAKTTVIKRFLQTDKSRRVVAKDRTSSLGGILEEPTLPMIWNLINA